jgi:hypothetical protein
MLSTQNELPLQVRGIISIIMRIAFLWTEGASRISAWEL